MLCDKCKTMMKIKDYYRTKNAIVYHWVCPKCGYKIETKEGTE